MDNEPNEEELSKLQEAISYLADLVSEEITLNKSAIDDTVLKFGLNGHHDWIKNVLELAYPFLERAHNDVDGAEREIIIRELERLGIKKFPAILTYIKVKAKPPQTDKSCIDFTLKPGISENFTLKVTGGIVEDIFFSDVKRLKEYYGYSEARHADKSKKYYLERFGIMISIEWIIAKDRSTAILIQATGNLSNKSLDDNITIKTNKGLIPHVPISIKVGKEVSTVKVEKEVPMVNDPPLITRCPYCDPNIHRKTLFYNKGLRRSRCSQCEREFSHPDKRVGEYNNTHP